MACRPRILDSIMSRSTWSKSGFLRYKPSTAHTCIYDLYDLDKWEHSRLKESKFIVNRSRKLGQYLSIPKNNEDLIMPNVQNVLKDTAISLYDMEDYKI